MTIIASIRARLIDNAGRAWRYWSVQFSALGSFLLAAMIAWPEIGSQIWAMLPDEVKVLLGPRATLAVPLVLSIASLIARFISQPKVQK